VNPVLVAAVPTPFASTGDLDIATAGKLFLRVAASGVDGLFVAGTTGEFTVLEGAERIALIEAALAAAGPDRVIAHTGAAVLTEAVALTGAALTAGARSVAAITPFGLPPGAQRVREYYQAVAAAAAGAALYVYIYPGATGTEVTADQLAELAAIPGLAGAKVSGCGPDVIKSYAVAVPGSFTVFSGNDTEFAAATAAGAAGVVSGLASAFPEPFVAMARALGGGDAAAQARAQARIDQVAAAIGPDIPALKLALSLRGLPVGPTRLTPSEVDPATSDRVARLCADLDGGT
jgi:4-hydroxy-tetrahydrodipicolinate synthase